MGLNLNNWKYVAPVNSSGKPSGSAVEFKPAKFLAPYFTKNGFSCPVPNAKHGDDKYGRSELRELINGRATYWSLGSGGVMRYTFVPRSCPGRMCVGQIHGNTDAELCKLIHENGQLTVLVDLYGSYPLCPIQFGQSAAIELSVKRHLLKVKATVNGGAHLMSLDATAKYKGTLGYFKFGIYANTTVSGSYAIDVMQWPEITH